MHDDEDIAMYLLRAYEVVNTIRGLDEKLEEPIVLQKVLIYFPEIFNPKVSAIGEMKKFNTLTSGQLLVGTLTTYEIIFKWKTYKK